LLEKQKNQQLDEKDKSKTRLKIEQKLQMLDKQDQERKLREIEESQQQTFNKNKVQNQYKEFIKSQINGKGKGDNKLKNNNTDQNQS